MTTNARYVKYSFTCPNGHTTESREEMIFADSAQDAANVVTKKQLVCGYCNTPLADKSLVRFMMNEPMPSASSE